MNTDYFQLKDADGDNAGIVMVTANDPETIDTMDAQYKNFCFETESPDGDPDGFVDYLGRKGIIAKRIFLTEVNP